jgi:hypothetical protein
MKEETIKYRDAFPKEYTAPAQKLVLDLDGHVVGKVRKPKRKWVDLTDADADELFVETQRHMIGHGSREFTRIFTRLINAKLKERNT